MQQDVTPIIVDERHAFIKGHNSPEENNYMQEHGYQYRVKGNYVVTKRTDLLSGMPEIKYNMHYFMDQEEAEKFASEQRLPSCESITSCVEKVTHQETYEEIEERLKNERQQKEARKLDKDTKKAEELGMPVEVFRVRQKELAKARKYMGTINANKATIAELTESNKELERKARELFTKWGVSPTK